MNKSIDHVQDKNNVIWRIIYSKGFAERVPTYFNDSVSNHEIVRYGRTIDDYLKERGAEDVVYKYMPDKWCFKPFNCL